MSRSALIKEYQQADILFLHLNDYAAFKRVLPSKIFEYSMLGKPILAGVAGYSATFLQEHVSWASVFLPCNSIDGIKKLNRLIAECSAISSEKINIFYRQFNRQSLTQTLATEIVQL